MKRISLARGFLWIMGIMFLLTGCSPWNVARAEQITITKTIALETRQVVGQTFVPNYNGMSGIEVFVDPKDSAGSSGEIRLRLASFADRSHTLAEAALALREVNQPGFYRFQFPAVNGSNRQDYYFSLELLGAERIEVAVAPGTVYLDGAMYIDHVPVDSQMAFQVVYDTPQMALGLGLEFLQWIGLLLAAAWMMILPGWALLSQLDKGWARRIWITRLVFAIGAGLSIYPLLVLWGNVIGLRLGAFYAWGPPLLAAAFLVWKNRSVKPGWPRVTFTGGILWPDLVFVILMVVVFVVRLWAIRMLDGGLWGDSYQHTMIAQLMVDHGGLFQSWMPYAELTTFTYHFGFHTWVSVFHWITGLSVIQSTLWMGQILNGLSIMALYPLALRMARSRWGGVIAILIAGLLMTVPMVYVNWGRYTQLAGQVIMPVAICLLWDWFDQEKSLPPAKEERLLEKWAMPLLNIILWSGLAVTHYRMVILALLFLPSYFLTLLPGVFQWIGNRGANRALPSPPLWDILPRNFITKTAWLGLGCGVLYLPWFTRVFGGKMVALFSVVARRSPQAVLAEDPTARAGSLFLFAVPVLWMLLVAAIVWGLWQRNRVILIFFYWWVFIFFAANPVWLGLPGEDLIADFTVGIGIYVLIGPLVGALLGEVLSTAINWARTVLAQARFGAGDWTWSAHIPEIMVALALLLAGGAGAVARTNDLDIDTHALMTRPDLRAYNWIKKETPEDSKFLVNAFLAFYNYVAAGNDGGWWLALMAERSSTLPPLNQGIEEGPSPDFQKKVNQLVIMIRENGIASDKVYQELKDRRITHVYIGQMYGKDLNNGYLLRLEDLISSPNFRSVYHEDRVWIFEVR